MIKALGTHDAFHI